MVGAVVLAAGESRRMGSPKMLLPWDESTVLGTVIDRLLRSAVDQVVVVLGHRADEVGMAVPDHPRVRTVVNPLYPAGMLTSIQCGVRNLAGHDLLIALGDQPLVSVEAMDAVLAAPDGGLCVPSFAGRRGHPILVRVPLAEPLLALPAEAGLRGLFQQYPDQVRVVPVGCPGILIDVDTREEYRAHLPKAMGQDLGPDSPKGLVL
jgi:molybdenum cofactor cytidylyltransferase